MPEVRCSKLVNADLSQNWDFVKEIDNWATLLPGYQGHKKIDDRHSTWTVRGEVGVLARTVELAVEIDEWDEESKVAFTLTGLNEDVNGGGVFRLLAPGSPVTVSGTAPAAEAGGAPPKLSWFRRLLARLRGRSTPSQPLAAVPAPTESVVPPGRSAFEFELKLTAGGMVGPVVNVMLDGMIVPVVEEFAVNVARGIESARA